MIFPASHVTQKPGNVHTMTQRKKSWYFVQPQGIHCVIFSAIQPEGIPGKRNPTIINTVINAKWLVLYSSLLVDANQTINSI